MVTKEDILFPLNKIISAEKWFDIESANKDIALIKDNKALNGLIIGGYRHKYRDNILNKDCRIVVTISIEEIEEKPKKKSKK